MVVARVGGMVTPNAILLMLIHNMELLEKYLHEVDPNGVGPQILVVKIFIGKYKLYYEYNTFMNYFENHLQSFRVYLLNQLTRQ